MILPKFADTTEKKLACCHRQQQRMIDWYNEVAARLNKTERTAFRRDVWFPRMKNVLHERNKYHDQRFLSDKDTDEKQKQKEKGSADKNLDAELISLDSIAPIGRKLPVVDPVEDFTAYTELDPNSRITVSENQVTFTGLTRAEEARVYKDFGVGHFSEDFEHTFTAHNTANVSSAYAAVWELSNNLLDNNAMRVGGYTSLNFALYSEVSFLLQEYYATGQYQDTTAWAQGYDYDVVISRDESVGTYGTLYALMYYGENLLVTLSVALHEKMDARYLYSCNSYNSGTASITGYVKDMDLGEGSIIIPQIMHHRK